jgi:CelD/BcsL family acetyltransferase involved in cellulose biosynthesis
LERVVAIAARQPRFELAPAPSAGWDAAPRYEVVETLAGLDALAEPWNALAASSGSSSQGFQSYAWLRSWARRYDGDGHELRIVLGWIGGTLALIWPLCARRRFGLTSLGFPGEPMCQYHDALVVDGEAGDLLLAGALRFIRGLPHDILKFRRVREDSRLAATLRAAGARVTRGERAPYIDFGGAKTFEAFERGLPAKTRSNRRRRLRQLRELGEIAIESPVAPERADEWIAAAMAFKREWALRGARYAPAAFDARFERCFRDAARTTDARASLRVLGMRLDGRKIGVEIAFGYRDRLFGHVLAPDPAFAKFGLGNVLADAAIEDAFARGYQVYDLLAPASPYKSAWTSRCVEVTDFCWIATPLGRLADATIGRARESARAFADRAPPALTRAMLRRVERRWGWPAGASSSPPRGGEEFG